MSRLIPLILALGACSGTADAPPRAPTVLFFITTDCPIANAFAPEINRIAADYASQGVDCVMMYTDLSSTKAAMLRHAIEFGYDRPALLDEGHTMSRKFGVRVTPEAVVLNPDGTRAYRGRIDDRYLAPGKYRLQPTTRDLRDALDAVLAGRPVPVAETPAAGCPLTD